MDYKTLIAFLTITLLFSCKKDEAVPEDPVYTTYAPGEYFPAYPETYWNYKDLNGNQVPYTISTEYEVYNGGLYPKFLNAGKYIKVSMLLHPYNSPVSGNSMSSSVIYSKELDAVNVCPVSLVTFESANSFLGAGEIRWRRIAVATDTIITVNSTTYSDVIIMKEMDIYDSTHLYFDYFAKGVGLIKRDSANVNDQTDLIEILTLHDYFIGPH